MRKYNVSQYVKEKKKYSDCKNTKKKHFYIQKIKGGPDLPAFYTNAPSSSYVFVESHDVYVKDARQIPLALPTPTPQTTSKADIFDVNEYMLVDDRALRVCISTLVLGKLNLKKTPAL